MDLKSLVMEDEPILII